MGDFSTIRLDRGAVSTLTIDRPEARNALNEAVVGEIYAALGQLEQDPQVRALIITGAGERAFVSGADIAELRDRNREDALRQINSALFRAVETFAQPTIAAIRGYALGGGLELAMACDLRVAGNSAKLGQPEVGLGIIPAAGGTYRLPRLVGLGCARELIFTGEIIDATTAHAIGLVNKVVDDDQVMATAEKLAARIAKQGNLAVRLAKQALNATGQMSIEDAMAFESKLQARCFEDQEKYDRMDAFLARRAAK